MLIAKERTQGQDTRRPEVVVSLNSWADNVASRSFSRNHTSGVEKSFPFR